MEPADKIFVKTHGGTFAKRCKHFAGVDFTNASKTCDAGVVIKDVTVQQPYRYRYSDSGKSPVFTSGYSLPCFTDSDPCGVCKCDHQSFPTDEEIAAEAAEIEALFSRTAKARAAVVAKEGKNRGVADKIPCPVCESGTLHYSIAQLNGHIWGKCSTDGCVAWME